MGQRTLVCHPDLSEVNHHFPWRENKLELGLFPQAFHPLIPSPHYSKTLYSCMAAGLSVSSIAVSLLIPDRAQFVTATWCYWHIIEKCATEKKTPC